MKRLAGSVVALVLCMGPARAGTTYYVKGNCPGSCTEPCSTTAPSSCACAYEGNGQGSSCATSHNGTGAFSRVQTALDALTPGDTLNFLGGSGITYHSGDVEGYRGWSLSQRQGTSSAGITIQNNGYTGGLDSGDKVIIDGVRTDGVGWAQCTWNTGYSPAACDCNAGTGNQSLTNVQIGAGGQTACEETFIETSNANEWGKRFYFATTIEGHPTYQVHYLSDMTNATSNYHASVCSTDKWMSCYKNADCPSGQTCGSNGLGEIDSVSNYGYSCSNNIAIPCGPGDDRLGTSNSPCGSSSATCDASAPWLVARFVSSSNEGYVVPDGTGPFALNSSCSNTSGYCGVSYLTMRGLSIGVRGAAAVSSNDEPSCSANDSTCVIHCNDSDPDPNFHCGSDPCKTFTCNNSTKCYRFDTYADHLTFTDNRILWAMNLAGSDYGLALYSVTPATITRNDFGYNGSESIHTHPPNNAASVLTIYGNHFHDDGSKAVMGPRFEYGYPTRIYNNSLSTPWATIFGSRDEGHGCSATADYTGSNASNNVVERCQGGFSLENGANHFQIHDNLFDYMTGGTAPNSAIAIGGTDNTNGASGSYNELYNNLITHSDRGISFLAGGSGTPELAHNKIYFNTIDASTNAGIYCEGAVINNNEIKDNIINSSSGVKAVDCLNLGTGNVAQYSLLTGTYSGLTVAAWSGANYTCATSGSQRLSVMGTGNKDGCPSPKFVNGYHLQSTSPAKDAGTATGIPTGRTTDWYIPLAGTYNFANYGDLSIDQIDRQGLKWDMGGDEYINNSCGTPPCP